MLRVVLVVCGIAAGISFFIVDLAVGEQRFPASVGSAVDHPPYSQPPQPPGIPQSPPDTGPVIPIPSPPKKAPRPTPQAQPSPSQAPKPAAPRVAPRQTYVRPRVVTPPPARTYGPTIAESDEELTRMARQHLPFIRVCWEYSQQFEWSRCFAVPPRAEKMIAVLANIKAGEGSKAAARSYLRATVAGNAPDEMQRRLTSLSRGAVSKLPKDFGGSRKVKKLKAEADKLLNSKEAPQYREFLAKQLPELRTASRQTVSQYELLRKEAAKYRQWFGVCKMSPQDKKDNEDQNRANKAGDLPDSEMKIYTCPQVSISEFSTSDTHQKLVAYVAADLPYSATPGAKIRQEIAKQARKFAISSAEKQAKMDLSDFAERNGYSEYLPIAVGLMKDLGSATEADASAAIVESCKDADRKDICKVAVNRIRNFRVIGKAATTNGAKALRRCGTPTTYVQFEQCMEASHVAYIQKAEEQIQKLAGEKINGGLLVVAGVVALFLVGAMIQRSRHNSNIRRRNVRSVRKQYR